MCHIIIYNYDLDLLCRDMYLLFRKHGTILSVHTMINKNTGLSKGYGFVSFADKDEARTAMEQMNGFRVSSVYDTSLSAVVHSTYIHHITILLLTL
jgi:hypothetical protein